MADQQARDRRRRTRRRGRRRPRGSRPSASTPGRVGDPLEQLRTRRPDLSRRPTRLPPASRALLLLARRTRRWARSRGRRLAGSPPRSCRPASSPPRPPSRPPEPEPFPDAVRAGAARPCDGRGYRLAAGTAATVAAALAAAARAAAAGGRVRSDPALDDVLLGHRPRVRRDPVDDHAGREADHEQHEEQRHEQHESPLRRVHRRRSTSSGSRRAACRRRGGSGRPARRRWPCSVRSLDEQEARAVRGGPHGFARRRVA